MSQLTVKQFLLKKFPTNEYMDCPIGKHHWDTIQEYAESYHASLSPSPTSAHLKTGGEVTEFSKYMIEEINGYQNMRDGWKDGTPNYETYDLIVRELRKIADKYIQFYCTSLTPIVEGVSKEEMQEICRSYAESKMPVNWDRKDHINLGTFYKYFIDKLSKFTTQTKEAGTGAVEKAFKRGYDLGHDGGCIEGASGYYADACWQTYKHENKI